MDNKTRVNEHSGSRICYALTWKEGCPDEPGVYLFRMPRGHDLSGLELCMRLTEPTAYDWFVVTLVHDEEFEWLEWESPRDGTTRVAKSALGEISVWWAKLNA